MKKIQLLLSLSFICLGLITSCDNLPEQTVENQPLFENIDGTITIQGRVLVKNTNKPPIGINTVNIANKWKFYKEELNAKGENEKVFVNKEGYYKITIQKEDTIQLIPYKHFYKQNNPAYKLHGLKKNQIVNFYIETESPLIEQQIENKSGPGEKIFNVNPNKLVTLAGKVINKKTGKPLENVMVMSVFNYSTLGCVTHHLTDKDGQFVITLPQNSLVAISSDIHPSPTNVIQKDTIITYYL